mmetsp:Transcript_31978/g.73494  ORF Transcript_31978/g.73494 Transcript_31978/m.73494 type:complete len:229 (-) Transcript_31978:1792-2478(-)
MSEWGVWGPFLRSDCVHCVQEAPHRHQDCPGPIFGAPNGLSFDCRGLLVHVSPNTRYLLQFARSFGHFAPHCHGCDHDWQALACLQASRGGPDHRSGALQSCGGFCHDAAFGILRTISFVCTGFPGMVEPPICGQIPTRRKRQVAHEDWEIRNGSINLPFIVPTVDDASLGDGVDPTTYLSGIRTIHGEGPSGLFGWLGLGRWLDLSCLPLYYGGVCGMGRSGFAICI